MAVKEAHSKFRRPTQKLKDGTEIPQKLLLNNGYWLEDEMAPDQSAENDRIYIVSGAGDGALIDILRLCIREFGDTKWHGEFTNKMNELINPNLNGTVWANRRDLLVFADELMKLFESDEFKLIEGKTERLAQIERTMNGFDIDAFLDQFNIELNDIEVYSVSRDIQPFWAASSVAHRLLVWCLYEKGRVRFMRGELSHYNDGMVSISRSYSGKIRNVRPEGIILRHGVGEQAKEFLSIQGLLIDMDKQPDELANDGQRLVSLLRLSNKLHPETEKFFRHTIKHLR